MTSKPQQPPPIDHRWFRVAGVILIAFLGSGMSWYSMGVLFSPLVEEFGWKSGTYSAAVSIFLILMTLSSIPTGRLVDRLGARRVMLYAALLNGLSWGLISQMGRLRILPTIWQLYLLYGMLAVSSAGVGGIPINAIITHWFTQKKGLAVGLSIVGFGLPGVIMVPLSGPFLATHSWRLLALTFGALSWCVSVPCILGALRDRSQGQGTSRHRSALPGILARDAVRMTPFWIIGISYLLAQFGSVAVQMHAIPFLTDRGLSHEIASSIWGFLALSGIMGKIGLGYAADHIAPKKVLIVSILLQVGGLVTALTWPSLPAACVFALLFGLGMGGLFSTRPLLVGEYFGMRAFATILGMIELFTLPGTAIGQSVAGFLYDLTSSYELSHTIFIGTFFLSMAILASLSDPEQNDARDPA
ncbi:MAG: MFS transporter [Anaerolineae bacterium]